MSFINSASDWSSRMIASTDSWGLEVTIRILCVAFFVPKKSVPSGRELRCRRWLKGRQCVENQILKRARWCSGMPVTLSPKQADRQVTSARSTKIDYRSCQETRNGFRLDQERLRVGSAGFHKSKVGKHAVRSAFRLCTTSCPSRAEDRQCIQRRLSPFRHCRKL